MSSNFPIFPVGTIFKACEGEIKRLLPRMDSTVRIDYPCRLNGMTIDSSAIALESATSFPAGEICFSIAKFVHTTIEINNQHALIIDDKTERKAIVKHACLIMSKALNIEPTFSVSVGMDADIKKHCGFGTSGAVMASVCVAINELYGNPIEKLNLAKYMANNYGEEIDDDCDNLKLVQCVGGSVGNGLVDGGAMIIAGNATPIFAKKCEAEILIAIPKDFIPKSAKEMMELEENNLDSFVAHGKKYARDIAYNLVHEGMPLLAAGDLSGVCEIIYRHRFEMGSIQNCAFVYPEILGIAERLKFLYQDKYCQLLSMSSVGPALFLILDDNDMHREKCQKALEEQGLEVVATSIYNKMYTASVKERRKNETS